MTTETDIVRLQYVVDPDVLRAQGRSPEAVLLSRRCASCRVALGKGPLPSAEQQFKEIAEHCAAQPGFISPDMSTLEIAFRIILQRGNQPTTLHALHSQITDDWATPLNPRTLPLAALRRLLSSDTYYGFQEMPPEG